MCPYVLLLPQNTRNFHLTSQKKNPKLFCKEIGLRPWSLRTANSDKKYMELNGASLNVNKLCVTSWKTASPKDK